MISPAQPQSSPSNIWVDQDLDSEVRLLYLFQRARTELFKTESSSTIRAPPPRIPGQPLTPDTKWRRLRAAAALSRDHDLDSEVRLFKLYLFQRARTELFKTESSSTIRAPPPRIPGQPLTPDTKWRRLRAAAALSRERARALASSPVVSPTSQPQASPSRICVDRGDLDSEVSPLYLFQRAQAKFLKTESSSTVPCPPPKLPSQPLTPDTKWRRLRAAAALSRERAWALPASSPVVSSTSPVSAVRRRMTRHQAGKAAGHSYCNSSRSRTSSSSSLVKIFP
jgi:hypothetical protein